MDREMRIGNRLIHQRIQQFRTKKHRQTLSMIKTRGSSMYNQTICNPSLTKYSRFASGYLQPSKQLRADKNLEIEKQNIQLFNKIASIIREKPKIMQTTPYAQSFKEANQKHQKKRQQRIKSENQLKRLLQQKPTIQNKMLYKDRAKKLKYLKLMGKFPYEIGKKSQVQIDSTNQNFGSFRSQAKALQHDEIPMYRKKIQDFLVQIIQTSNDSYLLSVTSESNKRVYQMVMKKDVYEEQFMKCGYNFDKFIGQLKLNDIQEIIFDEQQNE